MSKTDAEIAREAFHNFWETMWHGDPNTLIDDEIAKVTQRIREAIRPTIERETIERLQKGLSAHISHESPDGGCNSTWAMHYLMEERAKLES